MEGTRRTLRQELKAQTRQRLLDAAIEILDEEGEAGLTTTEITRRAGIAQSSFYVHFVDVTDLLQEIVDRFAGELQRTTHAARQRAGSDPGDRERLRDTFRVPFNILVAHPQILRLMLRSRLDRTTPLGAWSRGFEEASRDDLVADLLDAGVRADSHRDRRLLAMYADGVVALVESLALAHVEGRYPDVEEIVDMLLAFARVPAPAAGTPRD